MESRDEVKQGALWEGSLKLVGLLEGDTALGAWCSRTKLVVNRDASSGNRAEELED